MKNRQRYILQRNELDLLLAVARNTEKCPIYAVGATSPRLEEIGDTCNEDECPDCVQEWLNEEERNT